jgi:hypothetical protein
MRMKHCNIFKNEYKGIREFGIQFALLQNMYFVL